MGELPRPATASELRRWAAYVLLQLVPMGYTITYSALAKAVGTSPRAVGAYMRANPTPVIIPCHRVVGSRGLGGYSLGVRVKERLLRLEGALTPEGRLAKVIRSAEELFKVAEEVGEPLDIYIDP